MQGIGPYIPVVQAYRHPVKLPVGSDTENQPNQKFSADVTLKNEASLTLDELQVSLEAQWANVAKHGCHLEPEPAYL